MSSPKYSDKLKIVIYIVELSVKIFTENDITSEKSSSGYVIWS